MLRVQVSASSLILTLRSSVRLMAASRRTTEAPPAVGTRRGRISQAPSALPELTTTTAPIGFDCQSFLTTARKPNERHLIAAAAVSELVRQDCVLGTWFEEISRFIAKSRELTGLRVGAWSLARRRRNTRGHFRPLVSGVKIPFPGNRDHNVQRLGSNECLSQ